MPKSHKFGSVGSSWWARLLAADDDRLKLRDISVVSDPDFWSSVRQSLLTWDTGERTAVVFIHGFNVTFAGAAIRAAQIGLDLKTPGVMAFFSWPSAGRLSMFDYNADEASIEASERQIAEFLVGFAKMAEAERVHVIAHSMGNRGLLRAMQRIVAAASDAAKKPFGHLIFAAPDVDASVFRDLAKAHQGLADRATLYLSSRDRAVASSGLLHNAPRAGFVPPVTIVSGIDTVEVSNADLTFLGHGYYGAAEAVLRDIHELITHNSPPNERVRLQMASDSNGSGIYWRIGP